MSAPHTCTVSFNHSSTQSGSSVAGSLCKQTARYCGDQEGAELKACGFCGWSLYGHNSVQLPIKKHLHLCGAPVPTVRVTNHKPTTRTAGHATSARSPPTCPISHSFQNKSTSNQTKDRALLQRHLVQYHSLKKRALLL